jgi:ribosome-interacting GTPase 1
MSLIKQKLTGNTIIFDRDTCYLLEGAWKPGGYNDKDFDYKIVEVPKDRFVVRTNHGVLLDWAGYQRVPGDDNQTASRVSSESRRTIADMITAKAETPEDIIDGMTGTYVNNPQLNVLRTADEKKQMRTTSQIMIIPEEKTFFIRPVQSHMTFNFCELNKPDHDLWVEILSNRVLYKHYKEHGEPPFPKMNHSS